MDGNKTKIINPKKGLTKIGTEQSLEIQDIVISGEEAQPDHCVIEYVEGVVTLHPIEDSSCSVNGVALTSPSKLTQGALIQLGKSSVFRFNYPEEAEKLKQIRKVSDQRFHHPYKYWGMYLCISVRGMVVLWYRNRNSRLAPRRRVLARFLLTRSSVSHNRPTVLTVLSAVLTATTRSGRRWKNEMAIPFGSLRPRHTTVLSRRDVGWWRNTPLALHHQAVSTLGHDFVSSGWWRNTPLALHHQAVSTLGHNFVSSGWWRNTPLALRHQAVSTLSHDFVSSALALHHQAVSTLGHDFVSSGWWRNTPLALHHQAVSTLSHDFVSSVLALHHQAVSTLVHYFVSALALHH
ncbi:hypothetical protein ACOMHN_062108 [Nucella lapillus]